MTINLDNLFSITHNHINISDKILGGFVVGISIIGSFFCSFFGGFDMILNTLISLIILDYITGIIKAVYLKKLSSDIGFKGILKKILMLIIVGVTVNLQNVIPCGVSLRDATILFFICNEGLSIFENASEVIPLPKQIKSILLLASEKIETSKNETTDTTETPEKISENSNTNQENK
ncbi:MAG: phage holin family protein [Bacillota bacterium]|nr:phage holin family protein [Bacillota bacterium]